MYLHPISVDVQIRTSSARCLREKSEDSHSYEDLSLPSVPRTFYNRMLGGAYLRNCRLGFVERFDLITSRSRIEYEDRVLLARMESNYRKVF